MVLPQIPATSRCVGRKEISPDAEHPSQKTNKLTSDTNLNSSTIPSEESGQKCRERPKICRLSARMLSFNVSLQDVVFMESLVRG